MNADLSLQTLLLLALSGLLGGIGITAIGPGGVLPTISMVILTKLSPAEVAGTAIVTHVATGILGTVAYTRSGQLRQAAPRRVAVLLAAPALLGTPIGVLANSIVSGEVFGILLACTVATIGVLVVVREQRTKGRADSEEPPGTALVVCVGLLVAAVAGLFGLGGPMLSVPLLVICGLPVIQALAAAQVQSVVVASVGTIGYVLHGSIDWPLAAVIGVPELIGVLMGWKIAHAVSARQLKYTLAGILLVLAPYLALRS